MSSLRRMAGLLLALLVVADPGRALAMLEYVAADYANAVGPGGEVLSEQELREQAIFAREAAGEVRAAGDVALAAEIDELGKRVEARGPAMQVASAARQLALRVAAKFQLAVLPHREPDLRRGGAVWRQSCAACHGAKGMPQVDKLDLSTPPTRFALPSDVARLSPQRIFAAITYGVPDTAMPEFGGAIDPASRWDVAFYALQLARPEPSERARGEAVLKRFPRRPDWLQLALRSDVQLAAALRGLSPDEREAVLAAVRSAWGAPQAVSMR